LTDPESLWSELVQSEEVVFGGIAHSFHVNMLEELEAVSSAGYEANEVIRSQLTFTVDTFKQYLSARPIWGGILARRHSDPDCRNVMELWFSLIAQQSRRDQLSLPAALRALKGSQTQVSFLDNQGSDFYKWPVGGYVKPSDYAHRNIEVLGIETLYLNQMDTLSINRLTAQRNLLEVTVERDAVTAERDAVTAERDAVTAERDAVTAERDAVTAERDAVTAERDAVTAERDAIVNTKVWRWTKGLRNLVFRLRTILDF
jgi:hypothetical protein